jgi:hypothetical protein
MKVINMRLGHLKDDITYQTVLGSFTIGKYIYDSRQVPQTEDYLRYLYSLSPLELAANGESFFVPERSITKVGPSTKIDLRMEHGTALYLIKLLKDEQQFIDDLKTIEQSHFQSLEDKASEDPRFAIHRDEWGAVSSQHPGYYLETEKNKESVIRSRGILIAPPHSRMNPMSGNGWLVMYARGSIPLGIGSDYIFGIRNQEAPHIHNKAIELYLCLGGEIIVLLNGEEYNLKADDILMANPGEIRSLLRIDDIPYKGLTLQFPSIPGDKYSPDGERLVR